MGSYFTIDGYDDIRNDKIVLMIKDYDNNKVYPIQQIMFLAFGC